MAAGTAPAADTQHTATITTKENETMKFVSMKNVRGHLTVQGGVLLDRLMKFAVATMAEPDTVWPMVHAEQADGKAIVVSLASMPEDRELVTGELRRLLEGHDVVRYGFMAESWMAQLDGENDERRGIRPKDRDDRSEVLAVIVKERGNEAINLTLDIERDEVGRGRLVESAFAPDGTMGDSPWAELLD